MAEYPTAVKTFSAVNNGDTITDTLFEAAYDEITAMQQAILTDGLEHNLFPQSSADARTLGTSSKYWGLSFLKGVNLLAAAELTVATGAVTASQGLHRLDTEADAASDDLDTITAGSGMADGFLLVLRAENTARVVTLKDGTGNLLLGGDYALSATDRTITLIYDGTNWREIARSVQTATATTNPVRVLDRDVVVAEVVSTTAETTVYTYSVAGGTLGTTKALRLTLIGDFLNNTGGAVVVTIRVKYGATTVCDFGGISATTSASRRNVRVEVNLSAFNSTSAQVAVGSAWLSPAGGSGTVTLHAVSGTAGTAATEDSTASKAFAVTVELDTSSASASFKASTVQLELLD